MTISIPTRKQPKPHVDKAIIAAHVKEKSRLTVYIPTEDLDALRLIAAKGRTSTSDIMCGVIREYLDYMETLK